MKPRVRRALRGAGVFVSAVALYFVSTRVCLSTWWRTRLVLPRCPDGEIRQVAFVEAHGLHRGGSGRVAVGAVAHYTTGDAESGARATVRSFTATLALVDAGGKETPLEARWEGGGDRRSAPVTLPEVPDGDYLLRARVASRLGDSVADLPLALHAPARVHVLTDRPLYEPGHTVRFRAVVLARATWSRSTGGRASGG